MKHLSTQSAEITYTIELTESELITLVQICKKVNILALTEYQNTVLNNLEKLLYKPKTVTTVSEPQSNMYPPGTEAK